MIGILEWNIRSAGTTLNVIGGGFNIDDQSVPAISADIVVPFDADMLAALDPRTSNVPRVVLTGSISEWSSRSLSTLSEYADSVGGTIADLSAVWAGKAFWGITATYGTPLHASARDEPQTMSLDLHVREISYDSWEMVISLASDEALLTDWAPTDYDTDIVPLIEAQEGSDPNRVLTYVDPLLLAVTGRGVDWNVYSDTSLTTPSAELFDWSKYETAWNMIRAALDDADLKLRVNPTGVGFTLQRPVNSINNSGTHAWLFKDEDCISVRHVYTRSGDWYDSAILTKEGATNYGYPDGKHTRTYREEMPEGISPSQSMAENIVTRSSNRGHFIDISAPIQLGVFMRDEFTYAPDLDDPESYGHWIVKSVSYDFMSAMMHIRGEQRF